MALSFLYYYCWFKLLPNRSKVVEGVIPEDMINECTSRRQELIGTCTIWVFFFFSNQSSFCLSFDNDQSEQRKISQGANGNSTWNEVKLSVRKCQSSSPGYLKFWTWLDQSSRERGKFLWANLPSNIITTSGKQEMRIKKNINLEIISWFNTEFLSLKNCPS